MTTSPTPTAAATTGGSAPLLALRGLIKIYGTSTVVDRVDLDLRPGSIHALLGENGAGKSTLITMITGSVQADAGQLEMAGWRGLPSSVMDAQERGIVALPQELALVPGLDAVDNIYLGVHRGSRAGVLQRKALRNEARAVLEALGQPLHVGRPVAELSPVAQTMVAVARALVRDARVLILDEPTASLTDTETDQLFGVLRRLRDEGRSILFVSHRLDEVFSICDTATVLRNGHRVWTKAVSETNRDDIVTAMIGRRPDEVYPPRASDPGTVVLETEALTDKVVHGVSLTVRSGRVLGIAGLAGAGRSELLALISGASRPRLGTIRIDGKSISHLTVRRAQQLGIGLVPEERRTQGLDIRDTIQRTIGTANLPSISAKGVVRPRRERALAARTMTDMHVKATGPSQAVGELSGGNQQKVVLGKVLARTPRVLLLDEPTRGIDVGTKTEIYALIRRLTREGMAVVVVSSEIPELLGISDDIAVLHEGHLTAYLDAADADEESILHHCYGKAQA